MSRIFLSHSSKDNFEAIALRDWLASEGWRDVFLYLDPERGIAAGERWERALHTAANRCEAVIFVVSESWLGSRWCDREYTLARSLNKKLFAALIDPKLTIGSIPETLKGVWQVVDLAQGQDHRLFRAKLPGSVEEAHVHYSEAGLRRLKRGLDKAGLDARFFAWPPEAESDRAPYRGLKALDAEDAGIFFGRDAPIVEAIDRLRGVRVGAPPRLFVILGASGAGKSSFLRAGLLPRLKRDDAQFIPLAVIRPERAALTGETGLVKALTFILPAHSRADLRAAAQAGAGALRPLLAELVEAAMAQRVAGGETERPPAVVVAIDQAEELFRAEGREGSEALLALLADLSKSDDPAVVVIFAIRSDSYDALQNAKALEGLRQIAFSLSPMPRGAYADVIEGPARRAEEAGGKLKIEPALTQRLLVDIEAGAGDALPLLAFTLEQLYLDYRQSGALRLADYEKSGGLKGAIDAAVERALRRADADPRIPRDHEARLSLLRRGLIPWLAGVDPDSKTPRRNIARRTDIPPEAAPLIDLLVEERLLSADTRVTRDPKTGEEARLSTIEPTHEALLRQWGLLDGWLKEDFGLLTTLEGVKRATRDWDANARGEAWLAHQGQRLAEAQALDARPDIAARLDPTDRAYLADCRAREEAARAEAEQRRREREEEQKRRLADARKIARRTAVGAAVALVFAIAAGAFGWYALSQRAAAERSAHQAEAQRVTAEAAKSDADAQRDAATRAAKEAKDQRDVADAAKKDALAQKALAEQKATEAVAAKNEAVAEKSKAESETLKSARNQSVALTALADIEADKHPVNAAKLALAAWPRSSDDKATPKLSSTLEVLGRIVPNLRELRVLKGANGFANFSPDGMTIVTTADDNTARLWEVASGRALYTLAGHSDQVNTANFSPDGTRIVTASGDKTARVWDAASGRAIATLVGHEDSVDSAAFSPNGMRVVTASNDKTARLWDAASGREVAKLVGHTNKVRSVAFSPNGTRVVTASEDKTARLWDTASGRAVATLAGHDDSVNSAAFSPNGTRVVTASADKTARLWDAASGRPIATLEGHDAEVESAAFSPDGTRVVTTSSDKTARVWDGASGRAIVTLAGPAISAAFSPDGTRIVTASLDGAARIWDAATGSKLATFAGHDNRLWSAAFSPDGTRVVTASADKTARLWDAATARVIATLAGHTDSVNSAAFSPDGTRIVTGSDDATARMWDVASGQAITAMEGHESSVNSAALSPDGRRVVTASADKTARIWDAATGRAIATLKGHDDVVLSAAFSLDGRRVVTASADKTARIWDAATGRAIATLKGHKDSVDAAAFSQDGTRVVTASSDHTARLWDAASGREVATLAGHTRNVVSAAFSPDGTRVLTASWDTTARIWNAASGRELAALKGGVLNSAAFSPDGTRIVTASVDNTARLWDAVSGRTIATLKGHSDTVTSAAFSPDGTRVVTASSDHSARLWDAASGRTLATLAGHDGVVWSAAFSPDGTRVVTASQDGTARVWDVSTIPKGNILQVACKLLNGNFSLEGVTQYPLTFDRPICVTDPPPPDPLGEPAPAEAAKASP